jgi:hypothetical protein
VVDVELLDDLGDGNGLVRFAILSNENFDATTVPSPNVSSSGNPARSARPTAVYAQDVDTDGDADQVVEFASADMLANKVVTLHGHDVVLAGETTSGCNGPAILDTLGLTTTPLFQ